VLHITLSTWWAISLFSVTDLILAYVV
jgi:hypothetical protein